MQVFDKAKDFIWRNARLLDRRRFSYVFEGGSGEAVLTALRAYQNEDGGFGHALEPDIRCPDSQPVPLEMALQIMDETNTFQAEMLQDIARYLRQITLDGGGVFRSFIAQLQAILMHHGGRQSETMFLP